MLVSPLKYQGNKSKLMPSILELLPSDAGRLVDLFGGSAVVSASVSAARGIPCVYNELDRLVYGIVVMLSATPKAAFESEVVRYIKEFELTSRDCVDGYNRMVKQVNNEIAEGGYPNLMLLWLISRHAHSNLLRTSGKDVPKVNIQFGRRYIADRLPEVFAEVDTFRNAMRNVQAVNKSYIEVLDQIDSQLESDDILYFDPPYYASGQFVYRCTWAEKEERELLSVLTDLHKKGRRFMLSNVVRHGEYVNMWLARWMRKYTVYDIDSTYALSRAYTHRGGTREVIVTNY
jgi:site-specific DNA-adenine methylase